MKNGIISTYPSLDKNINVDVAIIGAGISGALVAYELRNKGLSIAIMDKRHAGLGSTAASTAFLQYEIDTPLRELAAKVGYKPALQAYRLCRDAIYDISKICHSMNPDFDFHIKPSLQYATYKKDLEPLREEYALRLKNGFDVQWIDERELREKFEITASGAILSADGGEVDAYMLTHALLTLVKKRGHNIYNNTDVKDIIHQRTGIELLTDKGYRIKARKLIIACGYESLNYVPKKIATVHTTYALVSEPVGHGHLWHKDSLVWETARPYLYFRKVNGDRLLVGGRDDEHHKPEIAPSLIKKKAQMLEQAIRKRMPHLEVKTDYSWAGAFAETKDGLPYIGQIPERKHTYFALGYGGNGITFSTIAAGMIRDMIMGKKNKHTNLFSFNR